MLKTYKNSIISGYFEPGEVYFNLNFLLYNQSKI